jgi:predicted Zn-dependent protease
MLAAHKAVLDHLLHPVVLRRISDSRQYGNRYRLGSVVDDLTNAIFSDDMPRSVNTYRQNLQLEYVNRLIAMVSGETKAKYDYLSQPTALYNLRQLEGTLKGNRGIDAETRAHRANILHTIERGLDTGS